MVTIGTGEDVDPRMLKIALHNLIRNNPAYQVTDWGALYLANGVMVAIHADLKGFNTLHVEVTEAEPPRAATFTTAEDAMAQAEAWALGQEPLL